MSENDLGESMRLHKLGNSDIEISPVILGTWALGGWLWGGVEKNRADEAVNASLDAGINCIDTAPAYGFGLSEELVGKAVRERRDEIVLATKCGLVWGEQRPGCTHFFDTVDNEGKPISMFRCLRKDSIIRECDESLRRLNADVIDLYQCHWPDPGTPIDETMDALVALKEQGKIRAIGVSNFSSEQMESCRALADVVSNQPKYSLLTRDIESDVLPFCGNAGIGVIAYSPMEMGLLTGKVGMDRIFPDSDTRSNRPWFQPEKRRQVLDALELMKPIAEKYGVNLAQMSVAWLVAQEGVTSAIVGARNREQAMENAAAGSINIDPDDISDIREIFEPLVLDESYDPGSAKR